jgi:NADPH:quinone reductase-like Zn-dependent oxidoreductase
MLRKLQSAKFNPPKHKPESVIGRFEKQHYKKPMRLNDKIALITGSAGGIGQATVELFHKEGAVVIVSDIRDKEGSMLVKKLKTALEPTTKLSIEARHPA